MLERTKIASEMKDLDQPSRASLRKYGVRFGAYHIYVPQLLKPAARALASLLWALKQDNIDPSVLSGAQHLASSGRTSFPVDKSLPRDAYRVLGYRQAGERAVRVDILERLADLIRPALAWRETSPGEKPPGAFDGRSFVVTQAMTSLTGSAGEDFASILRALGYRMERRPPLPPKPVVVETPVVEAAAPEVAEALLEATVDTPLESVADVADAPAAAAAEVVDQAVSGDPAPSAALLPEVAPLAAIEETQAVVEAQAEPAVEPETAAAPETPPVEVAVEPAAEMVAEATPVSEVAPAEAAAANASATEAAATEAATTEAAPATPAEPQLVEVWRPGGRSDERRPRHEHRARHRHQHKPQEGAQAAEGQPAGGEKRERRHHRRRDRDFRKPREGAPAEAAPASTEGAPAREPRQEQRQDQRQEQRQEQRGEQRHERGDRRERVEGKGRDRDRDNKREQFGDRQGDRREDRERRDRGRDRDKRDRESGPALRHYASSQNPRERDRAADPNSPFAKLAVLKEQLAGGGNRKE